MDFPRPVNRWQALAWRIEDNAPALLATLAALPVMLPLAVYLAATMAENLTRPDAYHDTGFCPDCPAHYDAPALHYSTL